MECSREKTIYSAIVRRGPDREHYDVCFGETGIVFQYLGEHWEDFRPRTGLQKQSDLLIYAIRKRRRRREGRREERDFQLNYCSIRRIQVEKRIELNKAILTIVLHDGRRLEIEYPLKLNDIVKKLVRYAEKKIRECMPR